MRNRKRFVSLLCLLSQAVPLPLKLAPGTPGGGKIDLQLSNLRLEDSLP